MELVRLVRALKSADSEILKNQVFLDQFSNFELGFESGARAPKSNFKNFAISEV